MLEVMLQLAIILQPSVGGIQICLSVIHLEEDGVTLKEALTNGTTAKEVEILYQEEVQTGKAQLVLIWICQVKELLRVGIQ
jgi:hypothetical protein